MGQLKDKMYQDHNVAALINPSSYERDAFAKRTIKLLFNILSLLFSCAFSHRSATATFVRKMTPQEGWWGLLPAIPRGISFVDMLVYFTSNIDDAGELDLARAAAKALRILLRSWMKSKRPCNARGAARGDPRAKSTALPTHAAQPGKSVRSPQHASCNEAYFMAFDHGSQVSQRASGDARVAA